MSPYAYLPIHRLRRLQLYALVTLAAPDGGKPRAGLEPGELGIIIKVSLLCCYDITYVPLF